MKPFLFSLMLVFALGCSTKQESQVAAPSSDESSAPPSEGLGSHERCLTECREAMAMQARSAEAIEADCLQQCTGEPQPLSPRGLE